MPIPKPYNNESRQEFTERCMGDSTMVDEYRDSDQRLAVCNTSYENNKEDSLDSKRELREDVFTTEEEAEARAEEIGCVGTHSHDEDGNKVYADINTDVVMHGMIAQEVKESMDKVECDTFGGWKESSNGQQEISKASFVIPLIKAVQELSAKVEELEPKLSK